MPERPPQDRSARNLNTGFFPALLDVKFLRFVAVGSLNTLFGFAVYLLVLRLTDNLVVAIVLTNLIAPAFNFFSMGRLVFNGRLRTFLPFLAGYGALCGINLAAILALQQSGFSAVLAQILCIPGLVVLSYLINDRLVFRERP
jgi:putative flippase GtrA